MPSRFTPHGKERFAEVTVSPRATKMARSEVIHVDEHVLAAGDYHGSTFYLHEKFIEMASLRLALKTGSNR